MTKPAYPGSPLHVGSTGEAVKQLQHELNSYGNHLAVDGQFGHATATIVAAFQHNRQIGSDGIVDAVTWNRIFGLPAPTLHPQHPLTPGDHLRALREEVPIRQRQLKAGGTPKRMRAVHVRLQAVEAELFKLTHPPKPAKPQGVQVIGNRAIGGTPRERLRALALAAYALDQDGHRLSHYDQGGAYVPHYAVTGEPYNDRSDCSEWFTSCYWAAGLPDPNHANFGSGYTGTLSQHGTRVSAADADWGDAVIWDAFGPQGHVAMHMGRGSGMCVGHGSAPIHVQPISNFNFKGDPVFVRYV